MKIYDKLPRSVEASYRVYHIAHLNFFIYTSIQLPRSQYAIVDHAMFCLITVMQHSLSDGGEFLFNLFSIKFTDYKETDYLKLTPAHIWIKFLSVFYYH